MFWSCPLLDKYWKYIFDTISVVLCIYLQAHPITAIFGLTMLDSTHLSRSAHRLIAFTALIARRYILFKWKDSNPPTTLHWYSETISCLNFENIRSDIVEPLVKIDRAWGSFIQHFHTI